MCVGIFVHIGGDMLQVAEVAWGDEHELGEAGPGVSARRIVCAPSSMLSESCLEP